MRTVGPRYKKSDHRKSKVITKIDTSTSVIQLAKLSGFSPVLVTASPKHSEFLKSLGATHVLNRNLSSNDFLSEIKKVSGDKPIQLLYDTVFSADTQQVGLEILALGGKMTIVLPLISKAPEDKQIVDVIGLLRLPPNIELNETLYHDKISGWLEKGAIKPNNIEVLPNGLAGIPAGLARMEAA